VGGQRAVIAVHLPDHLLVASTTWTCARTSTTAAATGLISHVVHAAGVQHQPRRAFPCCGPRRHPPVSNRIAHSDNGICAVSQHHQARMRSSRAPDTQRQAMLRALTSSQDTKEPERPLHRHHESDPDTQAPERVDGSPMPTNFARGRHNRPRYTFTAACANARGVRAYSKTMAPASDLL
jgi:hypothetical protein